MRRKLIRKERTTNRKNNRKKKIAVGLIMVLTCVFLLLLGLIIGNKTVSAQQLKSYISQGEKYLAELNYGDAAIQFRRALFIDPKQADVYVAWEKPEEAKDILEGGMKYVLGSEKKRMEQKLEEVESEPEDLFAKYESFSVRNSEGEYGLMDKSGKILMLGEEMGQNVRQ